MINLHARSRRGYPIEGLCILFGRTKQAYYKFNEEGMARRIAGECFAVDFIKEIRSKDHGIGGLKLWYMYQRKFTGEEALGRDRFLEVYRRNGLKLRSKACKPRTMDSTHGLATYANLIREFIPTGPNQLWVSDITYIAIYRNEGGYCFCYLTVIMDAYTEEIKGYNVGDSLDTRNSIFALEMALQSPEGQHEGANHLIHHSDRGVQYASSKYIGILTSRGIRMSMTESGDPKENPQAERIHETIKNEILRACKFHSIDEAEEAVKRAVEFYNNERPHMSVGMRTPAEASKSTGERELRWRSYREHAIKKKFVMNHTENSLPLDIGSGSSG